MGAALADHSDFLVKDQKENSEESEASQRGKSKGYLMCPGAGTNPSTPLQPLPSLSLPPVGFLPQSTLVPRKPRLEREWQLGRARSFLLRKNSLGQAAHISDRTRHQYLHQKGGLPALLGPAQGLTLWWVAFLQPWSQAARSLCCRSQRNSRDTPSWKGVEGG